MAEKISSDRIIYEDNHFIAVNKECGEIVQSDKTGDVPLIDKVKQFIKERDSKPGRVFLEVTHRIDRPVSGVVLFAKTSKGLSRINNLFQEGKIQKKYWAIVKNMPPKDSDTLVHYILRDSKKNKSYAYHRDVKGSKIARLEYELVGRTQNYYLLSINLITGRHHQIRAQLSKIGCPIRGDLKYGYPRSNPDGGINLHSRIFAFTHPISGDAIRIVADPPNDKLWEQFMLLGVDL
ncbi:RluA family pseudouridine synthase [Tenuifilum thalassicum]|uniref:RluA family pseudouridine synthase n=1 Tax=Tenuifilum thalassicum TaxID=2590900 RepID=A0A7D3XLQ8_9BACT|nr:RluA family pseudouridine synthase [Tenuifilum thalassicum]QKG80575.1 RluA family pseudouridine synthase [Tenuifilum thalassicum]